MQTSVRPATEADAADIAGVHVRSWQAGYADLLPAWLLSGLSVRTRTTGWRKILTGSTPRPDVLVAERQGAIAGFVCAGAGRDDDAAEGVGEVQAIYVDPGHWRAGLGTALHESALNTLRINGFHRATLWVLRDNVRAQRFYARYGWRPDGAAKTDSEDGVEFPEIRYARTLT